MDWCGGAARSDSSSVDDLNLHGALGWALFAAALLGVVVSLASPARPAAAAHSSIHAAGSTLSAHIANPTTAKLRPADARAFLPPATTPIAAVALGGQAQETIHVNIPGFDGVFTMTVSDAPLQFSSPVPVLGDATFDTTAELGAVTISDGRFLSHPGWSVSGQVSDFRSGGRTFSGSYLGWTPTVTTQNSAHDVIPGPAVAAGTDPGLTAGSRLAMAAAPHGLGTTGLDAILDLRVPAGIQDRSYSATLTITAVDIG